MAICSTENPKMLVSKTTTKKHIFAIVLAVQWPSNHLSPLASFTHHFSFMMPASGLLQWKMTRIKHLQTYHIWATARISNKQRPNADVSITIWALGVIKQHIVSIELLICDHEILEIPFAQKKKRIKHTEIWYSRTPVTRALKGNKKFSS